MTSDILLYCKTIFPQKNTFFPLFKFVTKVKIYSKVSPRLPKVSKARSRTEMSVQGKQCQFKVNKVSLR